MCKGFKASHIKRILSLTIVLGLFFTMELEAQCAMCRAVLESEENNAVAQGVNDGIVYLMAIPYILIAALFYFVFRTKKA